MEALIWCNTHQRPHALCPHLGGITMPCDPVDLTDVMEIEYHDCICHMPGFCTSGWTGEDWESALQCPVPDCPLRRSP